MFSPRQESTPNQEISTGLKFLYRLGASAESPLVVFVHGRAGDRSIMWTFERVVPADWHIVAFQGFLPDVIGGWSWWDISKPESFSEVIPLAAKRLTQALEAFKGLFHLKPSRSIALGFSQGGALLSAGALAGITELDGLAILAGVVFRPKELSTIEDKPKVYIAHGTLDERAPIEGARNGVNYLRELGFEVKYVEEEVGHKVGIKGTRGLKDWLSFL